MIEIPLLDLEDVIRSFMGQNVLIRLEQESVTYAIDMDLSTTTAAHVYIKFDESRACDTATIERAMVIRLGVTRHSTTYNVIKAYLCRPKVKLKLEL